MSDGSNGHNGNGHSHVPVSSMLGYDAGKEREEREPKRCFLRLENGGWCQKEDGHHEIVDGKKVATPCEGPPRPYGPDQSLWYRHRGQKRVCGAVTGPATLCGYERGHGGTHEPPK